MFPKLYKKILKKVQVRKNYYPRERMFLLSHRRRQSYYNYGKYCRKEFSEKNQTRFTQNSNHVALGEQCTSRHWGDGSDNRKNWHSLIGKRFISHVRNMKWSYCWNICSWIFEIACKLTDQYAAVIYRRKITINEGILRILSLEQKEK